MEMVKNAQPDSGESDSGQYQPQFQPMIRDLPNGERPRERLREYGSRYLSNTELIAILLRTGVKGQNVLSLSSSLLARRDGLAGLGRSTFAELCAGARTERSQGMPAFGGRWSWGAGSPPWYRRNGRP